MRHSGVGRHRTGEGGRVCHGLGSCSPLTRTEPHQPFMYTYDEGLTPPSHPIPSRKSKFPLPIHMLFSSRTRRVLKTADSCLCMSFEGCKQALHITVVRCHPVTPAALAWGPECAPGNTGTRMKCAGCNEDVGLDSIYYLEVLRKYIAP